MPKKCGLAKEAQGRSQDFSKGGEGLKLSKSLEKEKLLVIRIVKEST